MNATSRESGNASGRHCAQCAQWGMRGVLVCGIVGFLVGLPAVGLLSMVFIAMFLLDCYIALMAYHDFRREEATAHKEAERRLRMRYVHIALSACLALFFTWVWLNG